jgi:PAS domain S-box-containing protein
MLKDEEQREVRKSADQYRQIVEDGNSIILRMDTEGRITFMNQFAQKFFGFQENEILGKSVIGTIVPVTDSSGQDLRAMIDDLIHHPDKYMHNENENMVRGGRRVWIAWSNRALTGPDGRREEVICIGNDISEIKKAQELLREMDRRKSAFVANVSHEFKNPLGIIKGSLDYALDETGGFTNPEQVQMIQMARRNAERMMRLVSDLLDLSKIEAGKMQLKYEDIEIGPLTDEILENNEMEITRKKLTVRKDVPAGPVLVWADKDKLTQVILNLLSNAIKYTPDGGRIDVGIRGTDNGMQFEISDNGPGIAKEDFQKLFDKFERLTAERQEGTGLGLSIAKDIVHLHKGKIWVESEIGKGTQFIFTLPGKQK